MVMPINALVDLLEMALPQLQKIGSDDPQIEIRNPVELVALLYLAQDGIEDADMRAVFDQHLSEFRHVMYAEVRLP